MKDYSEKLVSFSEVSPTLFVGLGGSGSDIINRIAEKLKSRWNWHTLEDLVHFFAIDTNTHDLQKQGSVPRDNRILISDFDKRAFMDAKRGRGHEPEDTFVTDWVHDWYEFRGTRGAGAGQIRIESRLSLHFQLEDDRGNIIKRFNSAMNTARHHDNPYRRNDPPHFNVFIYGSIAGGTGSGAFLSCAYLLRELIESQGWIPKIYTTLIMPSMFLNDVPGALHSDINANGYAALKELENLMKLGAEGGSAKETFQYNPQRRHQPEVDDKPFDFVYLADKPTVFEIKEYKNAIADAAYLLLYSPILGAQASDYDNYEKHQKGLVSNYTVYYGSNGCSILILPEEDILRYCSKRFAARAMRQYLLLEDADGAFAINFNDPKFQRLSKEAQHDEIDAKFSDFITHRARLEVDEELENGPFSRIADLLTPTGSDLIDEFDARVDAFADEIREKISLETLTVDAIPETNIKIDTEVNALRNQVSEARAAIRPIWDSVRQDIQSGRIIGQFFDSNSTNPFAQRLFLIRMKSKLRELIDELTERVSSIEQEVDLDSDHVTSQVSDWRTQLNETKEWTLMEKLKRSNEDFEHARSGFMEWFNGTLVEGNRAQIVNAFRRDYLRATLEHFEKRLDSFRSVAVEAEGAITALEKACEEARQTGRFSDGDGQSNAFVLDVEALQEVGGERLWDLYFEDRFVADGRELNYFKQDAIFPIITEAFSPRQDDTGKRVSRSSRQITTEIRESLIELGTQILGPEIVGTRKGGDDISERGLRLDDALFYEAEYHFVRQYRADGTDQKPTQKQIQDYLKTKLRFCNDKAAPLANLKSTEDSRVINSVSALIGIHDAYRERLGPLADEVLPNGNAIPHWHDEKAIVFYHANLGIPLFYYQRVNSEMKAHYARVMSQDPSERGYPLHIDSSWEDDLPDLDPNEVRDAQRDEKQRDDRINFMLGFAIGIFRESSDGEIFWHIETFDGSLGKSRPEAFKQLSSLDARTLRRIEARISEARRKIEVDHDPILLKRLRDYADDLDEAIWKLEQSSRSAPDLLRFLEHEDKLLKDWQPTVTG